MEQLRGKSFDSTNRENALDGQSSINIHNLAFLRGIGRLSLLNSVVLLQPDGPTSASSRHACLAENDREIAEAMRSALRPRELPLQVFDQHRHSLSAAEAHGNDAVTPTRIGQVMHGGNGHADAGCPGRMTD